MYSDSDTEVRHIRRRKTATKSRRASNKKAESVSVNVYETIDNNNRIGGISWKPLMSSPFKVKTANSIGTFRNALKRHLFRDAIMSLL